MARQMGEMTGVDGASSPSSSSSSSALRFPHRVHALDWPPNAARGSREGPRLIDKHAFVEDLRQYSLAFVRCPAREALHIASAFEEGAGLLEVGKTDNGVVPVVDNLPISCVYKKQGLQKERLQARRAGLGKSQSGGPAQQVSNSQQETLAEAMSTFESVAMAAFEAFCAAEDIPFEEALDTFGDLETQPSSSSSRSSGKSKSVLNLYHYFNEDACDEEPCREHADPGLLTVLCRSSNAALEVQLPRAPGGSPGVRANYEEEWLPIEPWMDGLGCTDENSRSSRTQQQPQQQEENKDNDNSDDEDEDRGSMVLLIAVGETMERLTGSTMPACSHRVVRTSGLRFNMAYEMRPRQNVWHPWGTQAHAAEPSVGEIS